MLLSFPSSCLSLFLSDRSGWALRVGDEKEASADSCYRTFTAVLCSYYRLITDGHNEGITNEASPGK